MGTRSGFTILAGLVFFSAGVAYYAPDAASNVRELPHEQTPLTGNAREFPAAPLALGRPPHVPVPAADAAKYSGIYYSGDGTGVNIHLALLADGTYAADWWGCMGRYGEAVGNWRVAGKDLLLTPLKATHLMKKFTTNLDVVERDGQVVFVEPTMRDFFKKYGISRASCFQRHQIKQNDRSSRWSGCR